MTLAEEHWELEQTVTTLARQVFEGRVDWPVVGSPKKETLHQLAEAMVRWRTARQRLLEDIERHERSLVRREQEWAEKWKQLDAETSPSKQREDEHTHMQPFVAP